MKLESTVPCPEWKLFPVTAKKKYPKIQAENCGAVLTVLNSNEDVTFQKNVTQLYIATNKCFQIKSNFFTCADALSSPEELPSETGYVISAANSKPIGR